jgi:hypothetical protein
MGCVAGGEVGDGVGVPEFESETPLAFEVSAGKVKVIGLATFPGRVLKDECETMECPCHLCLHDGAPRALCMEASASATKKKDIGAMMRCQA